MFSILKKPQNSINADDLEQLQNEIEKHLVSNVKQRWKLERYLNSTTNVSPETASQPAASISNDAATAKAANSLSQSTSSLPGGKLRNSMKLSHIDTQLDDATDGFKGSIYSTNNHSNGAASGPNSNETDSISSESSQTSILTGSTIITATLTDSQQQSATNKRSLKNTINDRPSKRFRQNSSNSVPSIGAYPKRPPYSKHRSKIIPVSDVCNSSLSLNRMLNAQINIHIQSTTQSKFRNATEESRPNKKQIQKNEAPDKLWPFVEQFCVTPTEEQIKVSREMIKVDGT